MNFTKQICFFTYSMPPIASSSSPLFPRFAEYRIPLADQVEIAYIDNGKGDYPPLVLLHGIFDNKATWFRLTAHLPGHRILAPDLIGHGHSSKPTFATRPTHERYSPDMQVGYLATFIAALDSDDIILVGNSLGGGLALRLYLDFPYARGQSARAGAHRRSRLPAQTPRARAHSRQLSRQAVDLRSDPHLSANLRPVALSHLAHLPALLPRPRQDPPRTRNGRPRRT